MRPINFLGAAPAATQAAGAATDTAVAARAAELAKAAAKGAATATKAAGAAGAAPPPPPPRRPAGAGTQVAGNTAPKTLVEERVSEVEAGPPPPPAETTEELRAQQKAVREGNFGYFPALGLVGVKVGVPEALTRTNRPSRTLTQAAADLSRADFVTMAGEMALGRDTYAKMRDVVGEYVPDVISPPTAGKEKRNIAGREVVVYPRYNNLRADDLGPARLARLAREAQTPAIFETRRDALRQAFGQAKKDYNSAVAQADTKFQDKKLSPAAIEDSALKARERLQKVVDLREALRELKEPEGNLVIK
jgi:hypothetical protein